ncbi:MAG TPA: hypothetical protein VG268_06520 [Streptosporangiaceae bacterium]|jgi:hypothetical protein|nr:hypothetical protein [Streptosporangiaceae bacterium]
MAQLKGDPGGRHGGGPPWTDAPEVAAPGTLEPAAPAAPYRDRPEVRVPVRSGRHRRPRRKAGGRHHLD